jgi:hypothetical protein
MIVTRPIELVLARHRHRERPSAVCGTLIDPACAAGTSGSRR